MSFYLEDRVAGACHDAEQMNCLINEYTPFIIATTKKTLNQYIDFKSDELSIAMTAFTEAVRNYDKEKGKFLVFAQRVIRHRLIDQLRKDSRKNREIPFSALTHTDDDGQEIDFDIEAKEQARFDDPVSLEIEEADSVLSFYGISFFDLPSVSPKSKKTKLYCVKALKYILNDPELLLQLKQTGLMPLKQVAQGCQISIKTLERHRKYIITLVEISTGDYPYLSEYISGIKEVK